MPNTVYYSPLLRRVEISCYILLLLFIIPIKIEDRKSDEQKFEEFLKEFNKSYDNQTIYLERLEAFKQSLKNIEMLNKNQRNGSAIYGLTKYSDMLPEEFLKYKLSPSFIIHSNRSTGFDRLRKKRSNSYSIPQKVDWRYKNVVGKVQSQKSCGACWAFAAIGVMETMHAIKTGILEELSVQEMIDCSKYNNGCKGGDVCSLLEWIKTDNVTVVEEKHYPLTLNSQTCRNIEATGVYLKDYECDNFVDFEDIMLAILAKHGPLAVAVNAQTWQNYIGGTIQFHCDNDFSKLNHAVQLVGYDMTVKIPYYIVKNSWGEDFGDNGYLYLAIGQNICGLASEVATLKV